MRTEEAIKQLKPYLIGDLTPKETAVLEGHLDVDEEAKWWHARYYRQLLPVLKQPEVKPSPGVTDALFAKARVMIAEGKEVQRPALKVLANDLWSYRKVAAALVVAAGITFAVIGYGGGKSKPETVGVVTIAATKTTPARTGQQRMGDTIKVPAGSSGAVRLADGTVVRLTGGTEATLRAPKADEFQGSKAVRYVVELKRGDVMVDSTTSGDPTAYAVAVRTPDSGFGAMSAGAMLASVTYRGPVAVVERRSDRVIDLDMQRQSLANVLEVAKTHFGREVAAPPEANEWFYDVKGVGLDWDGYVKALESANIMIRESNGSWSWVDSNDGNSGRKLKRSVFDVTILDGLCFVGADGAFRMPYMVGLEMSTVRVSAHIDLEGKPQFGESKPAIGDTTLSREVVKKFLGSAQPAETVVSAALVEVLKNSATNTISYTKVSTGPDGRMLQFVGDGNKVILAGEDIVFEGKKYRVLCVDPPTKSVYLQDADDNIHRMTLGE